MRLETAGFKEGECQDKATRNENEGSTEITAGTLSACGSGFDFPAERITKRSDGK
jgi:hypothetical protein